MLWGSGLTRVEGVVLVVDVQRWGGRWGRSDLVETDRDRDWFTVKPAKEQALSLGICVTARQSAKYARAACVEIQDQAPGTPGSDLQPQLRVRRRAGLPFESL